MRNTSFLKVSIIALIIFLICDSLAVMQSASAPVHVVTGSAGCQEGRDHFLNNEPKWSAFRSQDFGYTRFKAFNKTHIYMEQVSVDLYGEVIDSMWLVKNKTVPFS